ncbi:hypothetical protein J4E90_011054 [Alternaria incomplexa]|uniref:uncharacterized protein n=1 Tax=Alternaria incomplexa TaxID=1187928 RepID=UPI00221E8997|nr:uncharacterized protein J4E90_011054 [Alternaria incomplexa]KAI4905937.1 hypothetical protein J4E90_011054 [Alternaria incomplexa]
MPEYRRESGICQTSESSTSYLSSAVACAVSSCKADESDIELVLGPLELYCDAIGCTIPAEVVEDAYAAVSSTAAADPPKPTHAAPTTKPAPAAPKPTTTTQTNDHDDAGADLTSAISTTITKTSTDGDGNTLQIIVPIVMGPTQISTGSIITSTVAGGTPVSTISSPSPSAQPSAPVPTPGASFTQTSSASGSEETDPPPANGNGSPFENMQAGAGRWSLSTPGMALGAFAALVMRM